MRFSSLFHWKLPSLNRTWKGGWQQDLLFHNSLTFHLKRDDTRIISKPVSSVPEVQDLDPLGDALPHMDKQPRQNKWPTFSVGRENVNEHIIT